MSLLKKTLQIIFAPHVLTLCFVVSVFNTCASESPDSFLSDPFAMCKNIENAIDKKNLKSACEEVIVKSHPPKHPEKIKETPVDRSRKTLNTEIKAGIQRIETIHTLITQNNLFKSKSSEPNNPEIFKTEEYRKTALFACIYYGKKSEAQKILRLYPDLINATDTQNRSILHTLVNGISTKLYTGSITWSTISKDTLNQKKSADMFTETSLQKWFSLFHFILSRPLELKTALHNKESESILETIIALQKQVKSFKEFLPEKRFQTCYMLEKMYVQLDIQLRVEHYPQSITDEELHNSITTYKGSPEHYYPFIKPYSEHQFFLTAIRKRNDQLATLLLENNPSLIFATVPLNKNNPSAFEYYLQLSCRNKEMGTVLTTESFFNLTKAGRAALHSLFKKILFERLEQNDSNAAAILIKNIPKALAYTQGSLKNTPLHIAMGKKRWDTISLLIKKGADLQVENKNNITPLDKLFNGKKDFFTIVKKLNPNIVKDHTPSKTTKDKDYFKTLCHKYIIALSPLSTKKNLNLSEEEKANYSRYFKKTPCESFENLLKQRNQKKLEKEKEIEEKQ